MREGTSGKGRGNKGWRVNKREKDRQREKGMSEKFTGGEKVHTEIRHEVNNQNENKSSSLESESGFSCCSLTCLSNMNRIMLN